MPRSRRDELIDPRYNADYIARLLPRPAELINLDAAGHFVYLAPCPFPMWVFAHSICADPFGIDRIAIHGAMYGELDDFFRRCFEAP